MPKFKQHVLHVVQQIPAGKVASYGQVAAMADSPRAARQVGWILAGLTTNEALVPWWRVVNSKGHLSIRGGDMLAKFKQKELLENEGVEVDDEFNLDMQKYRWETAPRL
ncbi:MGMT family protein [Candidatus Dojkabacteria bacterium]|uniref:MGMT family protein n=1 Tax=Candidatus Dojkabacteria bacterium TaxID=2099670 RepID=A0A955I4X6_9BACT|nr:MGMT family protein [Candidatus Dojkabacteria bacterium]